MIDDTDSYFSQQRRHMVQSTNWILCTMAAVFMVFRLATLGPSHPPFPALIVVLLTLINAAYLANGGSQRIGSWMLFSFLLLGLILVGFNTGAFSGPAVVLSPILPVLAVLLISARAGWIAVGLVSLVLSVLFILDAQGLILPNPQAESVQVSSRFLAVLFTVWVCTWVTWIFACYLRDLLESNRKQANTDFLTKLPNRRAWEAAILREIGRARRNNSWFSVIMADVDHFKRYNDTNGHHAGDRCLREVADVLQAHANRSIDMVSRFGGEEFVIMLPETDNIGASKVAEAIRQGLVEQSLPYEPGGDEPVSLTLGVVSIRGCDLRSVEQLLREADEALYVGKEQGRNRVISTVLSVDGPQELSNYASSA